MTSLRLGLLQYRISRVVGVSGFAVKLDRALTKCSRNGVQFAVLPEYACMEVGVDHERQSPDVAAELEAVVRLSDQLLDAMRAAARRHRVWLVPGSLPVREGDRLVNRAPLIAPDGRMAFQDKHVMTRFETESWGVSAGAPPSVFETEWGRVGIAICYDLEFPTLSRAQAVAGAWLIVAPSCTDTMHGFNRVRLAARARALENQCYVVIAPTVGEAPWCATLDSNRGHAAVYGPIDRGFPDDGVIAQGALDAGEWLFVDLDRERLEEARAKGAVRNLRDWPADPPPSPVVVPA